MIPNKDPQNLELIARQQITSQVRTRSVLFSLVCFLMPSVAIWAAPTRPTPTRASQGKTSPSARAVARRRERQKNRRTPVNIKRPERALKAPPALGPIPFPVGEHLVYKVNAMSLNAGTATLKVGPRGTRNGQPVVQLSAKITSSPLLEELYRIRDQATVLAREDSFLPLKSTLRLNEKRVRVTYESVFNQESGEIAWSKTRHRRKQDHHRVGKFPGLRPVYNALTSLYALRRIPLSPNLRFQRYVWDGRRERLVTVRVLGEDRVLTDLGWLEAIKLRIKTRVTGGFLAASRLNKPPVTATLWLSKDKLRTPLKIVSPTRLGEAEAILTRRYVEQPTAGGSE